MSAAPLLWFIITKEKGQGEREHGPFASRTDAVRWLAEHVTPHTTMSLLLSAQIAGEDNHVQH